MDLAAKKILAQTKKIYAEARSYEDTGLVETTGCAADGKQFSSKVLFHTVYRSPNFFKFERRMHRSGSDGETSLVVWFDGTTGYFSDTNKQVKKIFGMQRFYKSISQILNECLVECKLFTGSVASLTLPLLLNCGATSELNSSDWSFEFSEDDYFSFKNGFNTKLTISRNSGLIKTLEKSNSRFKYRTEYLSAVSNDDVIECDFCESTIIKEIEEDSILRNIQNQVGCLLREI